MMTPNAMTEHAPAIPWYRHRWPWLLIAGPAIVVVAALATAWLAWSTDDGVVADDYYKRGLVINRQLERSSRGKALGLGATLSVAADGAVRMELAGLADSEMPPAVRVRLANATRAGLDREATLARVAGGAYAGRVETPPRGRWLVTVETDAWRLPAVEVSDLSAEVRLGMARAVN
jgi:hypothetical protein